MKYGKVILSLILVLVLLPIKVWAKTDISLEVNSKNQDLRPGDYITITAKLESDTKLYAILSTFSYDHNVFEAIDEGNLKGLDGWSDVVYNKDNNKFGLINKSGEILNTLFKVELKVKDNASVGETTIKLSDISASNGSKKINLEDESVKLLITKDALENEEMPSNPETEEEKENTILTAFSNRPILIILGVVTFILLITLILVNVLDVTSRHKISIITGSLFIICLIALIILLGLNHAKKDVNNDNKTDYEDAKDIIKYIIDFEGTNSSKSNNDKYDTNNDGKVDVGDVGDITEETTNNTNYKVTLNNTSNEYYLAKNKEFTLNFLASVNPNAQITKVVIDNKTYSVINNNDAYSVNLTSPSKAGSHNYHFTKVILDNNREIKVDFKITVEVLKDKLSINDFIIENKEITFKLNDQDNSFIEGNLIITNKDDVIVFSSKINKGDNKITYDFRSDEKYNLVIKVSYDLDSDLITNPDQNEYHDEILIEKEVLVTEEYNFKASDVNITSPLKKNEAVVITFTSSNDSDYPIEYVVLDGINYPAVLNNQNKYEIVLPVNNKIGSHEVNIEALVLSNGKSFINKEDFDFPTLTYVILKDEPVINLTLEDDADNKLIKGTINTEDPEHALTKVWAVLKDDNNNTLDTKEVIDGDFQFSYENLNHIKYNVVIYANYDLGSSEFTYQEKEMAQGEVIVKTDIYISASSLSKLYPTKNEMMYVKYEISVPTDYGKKVGNLITAITINGLNYTATRNTASGDKATYTVSFKVPNKAGKLELKANRVMFADGTYVYVKENILTLDVLKDIPSITNFKITKEDYLNNEVTFNFDIIDHDNSFTNAYFEYQTFKQELEVGNNTVTLDNIIKDKVNEIKIKATYDLDTNIIADDQNNYADKEIFKDEYTLYNPNIYEDVTLTDLEAISKNNNQYFNKDEEIKLRFKFNFENSYELALDKVVIDDEAYQVTKDDNYYYVVLPSLNENQVKEITISAIILNNGKVIEVSNNTTIEVLKDELKVNDFKYEVLDNKINLYLNINDNDDTLIDKVIVDITRDNSNISNKYTLNEGKISFDKIDDVTRYYVKVIASYDLDSNKNDEFNKYLKKVIYEDVISLDVKYLELKDITDTALYNKDGIVNKITKEELENNLDEYFVKIASSSMPDIYSKIKEVLTIDNHLILVLDYKYVIDKDEELENLRVDFGLINDNVASNTNRPQTFEDLIQALINNPDGNFVLDHDFDAKDYITDTPSLTEIDFTGTLDGDGHTIKNLTKSLFKNLTKAEVKNISFQNVLLKEGSHGVLGSLATDSKISQILITGLEKNGTESSTGALVGGLKNSVVDQVKVTGLVLNNGTYDSNIGGIVGYANNESVISNSYVIGTFTSGYQHLGAIAGSIDKTSTIKNCFSKAVLNNAFGYANYRNTGGIVGSSNGILINNVSLSTGEYGYKIAQIFTENESSQNNYQLSESHYTSNVGDAFKDILMNNINTNFFKEQALFDDSIWNLDNINYDNLPTLKIEEFKLPNQSNIETNPLYNKNKAILYQNLYLLMPFYENETILNEALKIEEDNILNKEVIKHIIPITKDGNLVTYLTNKDYHKIKEIKVIFNNNEVKTYKVTFDKLYDMVVAYQINDLNISYTYNHYMLDEDAKIITNLVNYLTNLDYTNDLDSLTVINDSRLYRDYYNEVTSRELKEFVLKYLANSNYTITNNNEAVNNYIEKELISNDYLKKVLYVYNYFNRWYKVDINKVMLNDLILFNSTGFNKMLNIDDITNIFFQNENNFATNATNNVYNKTLAKYTNINDIPMLIEYYIKCLSNMDPDTWFSKTFKGYLKEIPIEGRSDITYSAWSHIKSTWANYALVILTLPERSTYIISSPTQYLIGSIRTYIIDPFDEEQYDKFKKQVEDYALNIKTYYTTASKILEEAIYFNNIHNVQIDHRFTKDENGNSVYESPYVTEEGFHKNFQEALNQWQDMNGTAAGANGSQVKYNAYSALTAYGTWSHESAHNQDARLFLKNNGRRWDAGGEDYADGNLSQRWTDGEINMNLSLRFKETDNMSANLVPERIGSPDKIKDFYSKLFDTYYILDYLEAKAYLQLSNEDQALITFQASYPDINSTDQKLKYKKTKYTRLSEEEFKKLELNDLEDLYDNKLVLYPGMPAGGTWFGDNKYGAEKIYKTRWYHPHNDYGRPDSYSLKIFAYEMLGYAGYNEGYIAYYSNINPNEDGSKTDLDALRAITKNPNITFKDYRMNRFKYVEDNLQYIQFIDVNKVVEDFYNALVLDAKSVREAENTQNVNNINNALNLVNSTEVKRQAYYSIKRGTNDFYGKVYDFDKPHEIKDFTINKD